MGLVLRFLKGTAPMRDHCHAEEFRTREKSAATSLWLILLFLLIVPVSDIRPQTYPLPPGSQADQFTIAVKINLVVLHATVVDSKGILVSGLNKEDFQVFEDGVPQKIDSFSHEDIPVTVGLVVDNSGSMGPKRSEVIAAALAFARSSNPQDQMFVVTFNENVSFSLPDDMPFTDQATELYTALSRIAANGMTSLYDAVAAALEHLKKGNRDKKVLIVISDGCDNASAHNLDQIMTMAGQSDAIIYTIGVFDENDPDRNPGMLKRLAKATGGMAFLPGSVKNVVPICERIAHDIRNQYTIAYMPTNEKQDGTYRVLQVKAGTPDRRRLIVRTRAGYYASRNSQPLPPTGANCHEDPD
jgi:Ca-activated chloride channel family protein